MWSRAVRSRWVLASVALTLLFVPFARAEKSNDVQTVSKFRVPSYDEQGELTSQMFGDYATIMPDGYVEVTQLRMEFYKGSESNRVTDMQVTAPRCLYHRERGAAVSDSDVRISRENMVVTGTGFVFHNGSQSLKILKNAKVVIRNADRSMEKDGVKVP